MIKVVDLVKNYKNIAAVKGINFVVNPGEIFGLIGPDGAGKTTTFSILSGVIEASGGRVSILGKPPKDIRLEIGYLTQKFSLYGDLSIWENLSYSAGLRHVPQPIFNKRAKQLLEWVGLEQYPNRLARDLSGGMKQKLALCCSLVFSPKILLLDEATTGVDPVSRREFWDLLATVAATGVTIVVATPYLDEAERCNRISLIYEGIIQQTGTLQQLRENLGLTRLELRSSQLTQAEKILQSLRTIKDIQFWGDRLDILVDSAQIGQQSIETILTQEGIDFEPIVQQEPTLENVFVSSLRNLGSDPPFIPFPYLQESIKDRGVAIGAYKLDKNFGDFHAVKKVNLEIKYGEIFGLLGANGAGKTTTIKMLCGLLPASNGTMTLAGERKNLYRQSIRKKIGYMSQKFTLYDDLSIQENLEFYCGVYQVPLTLRKEKIQWVLQTCGLVGQENTMTGSLPGGWKQRVAFGACVMHEPDILFLDEPTSGVDPLARRQFWRLIRDLAFRGTAILVTTHYLEEAESCHRMAFMSGGEIVAQGSPGEIKQAQPGQLFQLQVSNLQNSSNLLKEKFDHWRVAIFGESIHLVLDQPQRDLPYLRQLFENSSIELKSIRQIPFSLEDAFIGIVERAKS